MLFVEVQPHPVLQQCSCPPAFPESPLFLTFIVSSIHKCRDEEHNVQHHDPASATQAEKDAEAQRRASEKAAKEDEKRAKALEAREAALEKRASTAADKEAALAAREAAVKVRENESLYGMC
jgi:hypothetical protein